MADFAYTAIARCLASFNFNRIHAMMMATDWKWSLDSGPNGLRVPTVEDLTNQAERLLYAAIRDNGTVSSGGLEASYYVVHERAGVRLRFIGAETSERYEW